VESGDGAVVGEAVVPADDAEADDVALVVEDLEALGAPRCGEAGDDVDFPERPDVAVASNDVTALHEVLVGLRVVKAPHDGPHGGHRGGDLLHHCRAALVFSHRVTVVTRHGVRHRLKGLHEERIMTVSGGGVGAVDQVEEKGRHGWVWWR